MLRLLQNLYDRYFSRDETVIFILLLIIGLVVMLTMGGMLAPLLTSIVFAFLLQGLVNRLRNFSLSNITAVIIVYSVFLSLFMAVILFLLPMAWNQMTRFFNELPKMIAEWQRLLELLPQQFPNLVSEKQIEDLINSASGEIAQFGQMIVSYSVSSIPSIVALVIYVVLVPILVFFLLKDRDIVVAWLANFLPEERPLMIQIWQELNMQMANYIRGKAVEIVIVGVASYIAFLIIGMNYAVLLAILVGLSVVVPYIGATVVTIPVAMVGYLQWGLSDEYFWALGIYGIIQLIDGNVVVPIIFSEAVNLHPIAIITAVLVFGGFWGFWGVFFAIPLGTLIKAIINAWPARPSDLRPPSPSSA